MEQAKAYLTRFQAALTLEDRQTVVDEYKLFYATLSESAQREADQVMAVLRPGIQQRVDELDILIAKAQTRITADSGHSA